MEHLVHTPEGELKKKEHKYLYDSTYLFQPIENTLPITSYQQGTYYYQFVDATVGNAAQ